MTGGVFELAAYRSTLAVATFCLFVSTGGDQVHGSERIECLAGTVVGDTESLAGAKVSLRNLETLTGTEITADRDGRFAFQNCSPGWFELSASSPGYVAANYGATENGGAGTPLVLDASTRLTDLSFRLLRFGVISGAVRRPSGNPSAGTTVRALEKVIGSSGASYYVDAGSTSTNGQGQYRLPRLPPGMYLVQALPIPPSESVSSDIGPILSGGSRVPYAAKSTVEGAVITYFPSAAVPIDATPVTLRAGELVQGVEILLKAGKYLGISGKVRLPSGEALKEGVANLHSLDPSGSSEHRLATIQNGSYSFPMVQSGDYVLRVTAETEGQVFTSLSAIALTPSTDDFDGSVVMGRAASVTGRLILVGSGRPALDSVRLIFESVEHRVRSLVQTPVSVREDGTFAVNLAAGRYLVRFACPRISCAWTLQSIRVARDERIDSFLEILPGEAISDLTLTASNRMGSLAGRLMAADGSPATSFSVIVFPENADLWPANHRRSFCTRPTNTGDFRVDRIPTGAYRVAVVSTIRRNEWLIPEVLQTLVPGAVLVSVQEGAAPAVIHLSIK